MDVLAIQNLKKHFGSKEVLCGIDLSVPEHSIFGFIGKNGAGKTTTMKAILGLLKADSGEIYVMGEKVHFGQTNTNRHIGYLPDVPEFYSYMTPMEYLSLCGEVCGMDKTDIVTRSKELLELVGLGQEYHRTYFDTDGNLLEINTEGAAQVPEGYENAGRVVANSNSQEDSYFTDGGFEMVEGSPITTEAGSQVLIHEKFAQRNGLSVGDTMLLGNVENKDKTIPVTVAGIFTNTEEQDSIGMAPSYDLYDNIVFTDLSTASFLLYGTEGTTNVQYGDFYVNDPDELERMMTDVQELDGVDWESCTLTRYDNDYQNAKESLEGLQNIVFIAIAVVSVICFLVLALFLTLRLRGRIHETGVYLAMGISKGSVLLQYLLEVILVAAIALVISFGTSTAISHQIGSSLLSQVTSETYETVDLTGESEAAEEEPTEDLGLAEIEVAVSAEDYALVWAFGMVLCVASTALAAYPIMKMKPKSILSQMS